MRFQWEEKSGRLGEHGFKHLSLIISLQPGMSRLYNQLYLLNYLFILENKYYAFFKNKQPY